VVSDDGSAGVRLAIAFCFLMSRKKGDSAPSTMHQRCDSTIEAVSMRASITAMVDECQDLLADEE
jgi:hypothetical protein